MTSTSIAASYRVAMRIGRTLQQLGKVTVLASLAACMTSPTDGSSMTAPTDGSSIQNRFAAMTWGGLTATPTASVTLEALTGSTWQPFASATSTGPATYDVSGQAWYPWSVTVPPPRAGNYWPSGAPARFRAKQGDLALLTFTTAQLSCMMGKVSTMGYAQAAEACGPTLTEVTIKAPCDVVVLEGCYDMPTLTQITDYPFDRSMDFGNGLQGVTHDDGNWFFSTAYRNASGQHSRIARVPVGNNLNDQPPFYGNPYEPLHRHFGDIDYYNGRVYVPLERGDGTASYNAVGMFRASDLVYYPALPMPTDSPQHPAGSEFPWLARNPKDGLFYSSKFNGASELYKYEITTSAIFYRGSVPLSKTLNEVQGGAFTPSGRLYVSSTSKGTRAVNVIELSDPARGVVVGAGDLTWDPGEHEEIEGITVWDLDDGRAPGVQGQVHVIMIQQENHSNDDWYFKHMRANPVGEL